MSNAKKLADVQSKIDAVHLKQLRETRKMALECGVKKNAVFAERARFLSEKGPKDFWARVFKAHPDFSGQLMGEYDARILEKLEAFEVTHKPRGFRIEMRFSGPNDFFTDTLLWYEEEEHDNAEPTLRASGVQWRSGKGPAEVSAEDAQAASNPWQMPAAGARRERPEEGKGPSFFGFFERIPDAPVVSSENKNDNDDDDNFDDDEGFGDRDSVASALDEYEDMLDERREIARCLVEEIWWNPENYLSS